MLKQSLIYLVLSLILVIFAKYAHILIIYIDVFYAYLNLKLNPIFNYINFGLIPRKVILLVLIPVVIVGIPALGYRLIKGKRMPYHIESTWCVWLVVVLSNLMLRF